MPTLEENKFWNTQYDWKMDGDEWSNQAEYCKKNYQEWAGSIAKTFILKNISLNSDILEIAPGHGRWTKFLLNNYRNLTLADINSKCLEFCKKRFSNFKHVRYYANNGKDLKLIKDDSIDFIWSYDSFVHMEKDVVASYIKEFSRILRKGGAAIIHHPGRRDIALHFDFFKRMGWPGRKIYQIITINKLFGDDGWRSDVSKEFIKKIAEQNGLHVKYQINCWGKNKEYNIKLFNDFISKLVKL